MNTITRYAAASALATVVAIGGAGVVSAQEDSPPNADRVAFVCANLDAIRTVQADHATLLADRLVLLQSARAAAEGNDQAVARIDRRIERVTTRQGKVAERQEKLEAFAAEQC